MSDASFQHYGARAKTLENHTNVAGRYSFQQEAERLIVPDILGKTHLQPTDECLEVDCGSGNLLIPLSFFVKSIAGIDHPACLERLFQRYPESANIRLIPGDFLNVTLSETFNKVIIYSVLHYLRSQDLLPFVDKALSLVAPGGMLMLGDIPNRSKKKRFLSTEFGSAFAASWDQHWRRAISDGSHPDDSAAAEQPQDEDIVEFDDDLVLALLKRYRDRGFNAYVVTQRVDLPAGHTREDILIERLP